jgi:hypothetical protein
MKAFSADRLHTHSILNFQYHNETTRLSEHINGGFRERIIEQLWRIHNRTVYTV